ncbi:MAG TPA: polysaccharide deacetylase family protein [Geminicoccaceae bacterium]|nr:polysaccharide deacetylase family protein [Geminicoccaceae bacterium]
MTDLATTLGHRPGARVLIPHVDDVAVCHGANRAFVELAGKGFVTTGSVMVPCAWFPEIVALAKARPELDLGVHLTLTSESRACRWRPISTTARASGLIDDEGYMWPDVPALRRHAHKGAVEAECRAQIETALAAGLDLTHIDTHMGAAAAPEFVDLYLKLGQEFRLPVLLPRESATYSSVLDMGPLDPDLDRRLIAELSAQGAPLVDRFAMGLALQHRPCGQAWRRLVQEAGPGVTYLSLHCSAPGEIERLHPSDARFRIAEYELLQDPGFLGWLAGQKVLLTGFRPIREVWRSWLTAG